MTSFNSPHVRFYFVILLHVYHKIQNVNINDTASSPHRIFHLVSTFSDLYNLISATIGSAAVVLLQKKTISIKLKTVTVKY